MELSSQEAEIPMPINSVYGGVHAHGHGHAHMTHHHHHQHQHQHHYHHDDQEQVPSSTTSHDHNNINPSSSSSPQRPTNIINNGNVALNLEEHDNDCNNNNTNSIARSNSTTTKKLIKFRECQKNHAASMGGNATDGCGEFMPSGEEGTLEALTCSACNCHRNLHRKEILGDPHQQQYPPHSHPIYLSTPHHQPHRILSTTGRKVILGSGGSIGANGGVGGQGFLGYPTGVGVGTGTLIPMSRALPINVPYQVAPSATPSDQSDDHDHDHDHDHHQMVRPPHQLVKKRFRTKFSQEQKEKMLEFAEKVGWKIQKQEENVVQQFCQEIGVKRRVLKVWMHNNKHTLAKKNNPNNIDNNNNINSSLL